MDVGVARINAGRLRILLAAAAGLLGAVLILAGLWAIGAYVATLIEVWDAPDRSAIFWHLVFVEAGVVLLVLGGYFLVLGIRTGRNPDASLALVGGSLGVLLLAGVLLGLYVTLEDRMVRRQRRERRQVQAALQERQRTMHRLRRLEVANLDEEGFTVELAASGRRSGTYDLNLSVRSDRVEFLRRSESLRLGADTAVLRRRIEYRDLFRTCDTVADPSRVPVCVDGVGARSFFTVEARLTLTGPDLPGEFLNVGPDWNQTTRRVEVVLDTLRRDGTVTVQKAARRP